MGPFREIFPHPESIQFTPHSTSFLLPPHITKKYRHPMPIFSFPYPSQSQCFFFSVKPVAKSRMRKSHLPGPPVPGRLNFVRWLQIFSQHNYGMFPLHFNRTLYTHGAEGQIGMNFRGYYRTASPRCKNSIHVTILAPSI